MPAELTIGGIAALAGVNVETIRYYQRRGLLDEPAKPARGSRRYPMAMVRRIRFVKRAQALGFALDDIAGLLRFEISGTCAETRDLAARKLALIEGKLADLGAMRDALSDLVRRCDQGQPSGTCPIIQVLAGEDS